MASEKGGEIVSESLAGIPSSSFLISNGTRITTLPVICLALYKPPNFGFGFLVVTDLTDNYDTALYKGFVPRNVPEVSQLGHRPLERSKLFSISVPTYKVNEIWKQMNAFSPGLNAYDYQNDLRCNILREAVICSVKFRIKDYRNSVEGFLSDFQVCSRATMGTDHSRELMATRSFHGLMSRFLEYVDEPLYDRLIRNFPIDRYVKMNGSRASARGRVPGDEQGEGSSVPKRTVQALQERKEHVNKRTEPEMTTQPAKHRKLTGAQVMFGQQFTQEAAPAPRAEPRPMPHPEDELDQSDQWQNYAVNKLLFASFLRVKPHRVAEGITFETSATITTVVPQEIFVKPFKRTLKIARFRLVLSKTGSMPGHDTVAVELRSDADMCQFFGVSEIEELIDLDSCQRKLAALQGARVDIQVQCRRATLDFGYHKVYWGCASTLNDLCT